MVFYRALRRTGDEHEPARPRGQRFFDGVLNEWFVDDGQHFLGAGLRRRKEPGAASGNGKHCNVDLVLLRLGLHTGSGPWGPEPYHGPNAALQAAAGEKPGLCATSRLTRP